MNETHREIGTVYLVGAGPGDPGLLTLRGAQLLAQADVVVYDRLVDRRVLEMARSGAQMVSVGKTPGTEEITQEEINMLLVAAARRARTVVRLKGGDPFVFGRGAEEATYLRDHGVPFVVVPGVTSAVAVPAYAGIPVTDRRCSSSFLVMSGHRAAEQPRQASRLGSVESGESSVISQQTAQEGMVPSRIADTIVVLMGMESLGAVADQLIAGGWSPATPTAVVQWGTTPKQKLMTGSLGDIAMRVQQAGVAAPAVVVVGEVVRFAERLAWFDPNNSPLSGQASTRID